MVSAALSAFQAVILFITLLSVVFAVSTSAVLDGSAAKKGEPDGSANNSPSKRNSDADSGQILGHPGTESAGLGNQPRLEGEERPPANDQTQPKSPLQKDFESRSVKV